MRRLYFHSRLFYRWGMRKHHFFISFIFFLMTACQSNPGPVLTPEAEIQYDFRADVDNYLASDESALRDQAIKQLTKHQVSNETVKSYLASYQKKSTQLPGLKKQMRFERASGDPLSYSLHIPQKAPSAKSGLPLIVILHGMGGQGHSIIDKWVERLGDEFAILCPSYPMGAWWSASAEHFTMSLIDSIRNDHFIDENRVFIAGLSNGAVGAWMMGMFHADHFAGIVPIAGSITERYMHFLINLNNTALYSIQGALDPIFPIQYSRRIKKILEDLRYPAIVREHQKRGSSHGGHFLPEDEIPALVDWLNKQKRVLSPQTVRMVREDNHKDSLHWVGVTKGLELAALQLPGPEKEKLNIKNGKIATLIASRENKSTIRVQGQNVLEFEIFLNADEIDFNLPLTVTFEEIKNSGERLLTKNKRVVFEGPVEKNLTVLLESFKRRHDTGLLFDAHLVISVEEKIQTVSLQ